MFEPKRILVPTDFTADSDRALREAIDIAATSRGKVYLLHVDQRLPLAVGDAIINPEVIAAVERDDERYARQRMIEAIGKAASQADVEIEIDERHGATLEEIVAYMKEKLIDLVVIGPHARKGLIKVLQFSVTEKLMKDIACPMLVLPAHA
jgi:nucleotide-binding universal stress UspA family protein